MPDATHDTTSNRRRNLGYFFDATVKRLPDKVAIIDLHGGRERTSTYRQLDERMNSVASMLARLGVRPGERVAMLIGNRVEFVEFFFGAMRAGAIPLLLNTRLAASTLEGLITDAKCVLGIFDPSCNKDALAIAARVPVQHRILLDDKKLRWRYQRLPSRRRRSPTTPRRSSPTPRAPPAAPRARS
jgi:acyl-CoA synthetase (AMP-forming)/AMP-acid ligase II